MAILLSFYRSRKYCLNEGTICFLLYLLALLNRYNINITLQLYETPNVYLCLTEMTDFCHLTPVDFCPLMDCYSLTDCFVFSLKDYNLMLVECCLPNIIDIKKYYCVYTMEYIVTYVYG